MRLKALAAVEQSILPTVQGLHLHILEYIREPGSHILTFRPLGIVLVLVSAWLFVGNVHGTEVVDSNTSFTYVNDFGGSGSHNAYESEYGQCFSVPNARNYHLRNVQFRVTRQSPNPPSGTVQALLFDVTGTYGTSCKPTGSALATSDSLLIGADPGLITLTFGPPFFTLKAGKNYAISLRIIACSCGGEDGLWYVSQTITSSHPGNMYSWPDYFYEAIGHGDLYFSVNGDPTRVFPASRGDRPSFI